MLPIRRPTFMDRKTFHRDIDELFNRLFGRSEGWMPPLWTSEERVPSIDFVKRDDTIVVRAALPGIDPKDVDITVTGNQLSIRGERKAERKVEEEDYFMHEIGCGSFERTVPLPEGVNTEEVHASYRDGVLEITMPARDVPRAKKIEVETEKEPRQIPSA